MDVANYRPVAVGVPLARLYARIINARVDLRTLSRNTSVQKFKQGLAQIALLVTTCLLCNT